MASKVYRIFGSDSSPYSQKVRAYCHFKGIPYEWLLRSAHPEEFRKFAKLPIVPAVATPEGEGLQDSTPIIDKLEVLFPLPSIHPSDPALRFLSMLLEEFGDEWGNKWMFHYRWAREIDQRTVALRLAREMMPNNAEKQLQQLAKAVQERMSGRGFAVGSNERTAPLIEESFKGAMALLDAHLARHRYLFGARPAFGDFGLAPQLYQALIDPTAGGLLRSGFPHVVAWCQDMLYPTLRPGGEFEDWSALALTLAPILRCHVQRFLRWSDANAKALAAGVGEMEVDLGDGITWWQTVGGPQKYHAKSLQQLRAKHALVAGNAALAAILHECGCKEVLAHAGPARL